MIDLSTTLHVRAYNRNEIIAGFRVEMFSRRDVKRDGSEYFLSFPSFVVIVHIVLHDR